MGSALEATKKKRYFKAQKDANKAYVEQRNLVKQAKAHLAKLDGTTSKGTGSSKRSTKKPKETAAVASQADPALQAEYVSDIRPKKLQRKPLFTNTSNIKTYCQTIREFTAFTHNNCLFKHINTYPQYPCDTMSSNRAYGSYSSSPQVQEPS
jgi:hypothetical protein